MLEMGYIAEKSELGEVYYPAEGVNVLGPIIIKYVEYPWITCFEVEGLCPDIEKDDLKTF